MMKTRSQARPGWNLTYPTGTRPLGSVLPIPDRNVLLLVGLALLILVWLALILLTSLATFVLVEPRAQTGFEAFLTLGLLFGALVLHFVPEQDIAGRRLNWLALGALVLSISAVIFGFLYPVLDHDVAPNTQLYGLLVIRTFGTGLMAFGMIHSDPPRLRPGTVLLTLTGSLALCWGAMSMAPHFPTLVGDIDLGTLKAAASSTVPGTTPLHWALGAAPFVLGIAATIGAIRAFPLRGLGLWIAAALVMLTGAHLHSMFWTPVSSTMLTTSSFLRLGFTLLILTGGLLHLHQLLLERTTLLSTEQERTSRLRELAILKEDFTSMVAHELASPLGAISALADLTALDDATPDQRARAFSALHNEIRLLNTLVADVQSAIAVEGQEFSCHLRPVRVSTLFDRAAAIAATLDSAHHPVTFDTSDTISVFADEERIGQVLRNLIGNAMKYTPPGTPIHLRASCEGDQRVRVDVIDWGPGIDPADQDRIFGKYERAVYGQGAGKSGRGLGLYLSRNILRMHRSDLTLESSPGLGARFSFVLREAT